MMEDKIPQLELCTVEWLDVCSVAETYSPGSEQLQTVYSAGFRCPSIGEFTRLCQSYGEDEDVLLYRDVIIIPKSAIVQEEIIPIGV